MSVINGKPVTRDNLNDVMEFDHVIRVHDDGTVTHEPGVYAPAVWFYSASDAETNNPSIDHGTGTRWELLNGYSGQDRNAGPIMHDDEYIGGGMADDLLSKPGVYVAVEIRDLDADRDAGDDDSVGWAVAKLIEIPEDFPVKVLTAEEIAATCGVCRPGHKIPGEPLCSRHGKVIREVMTCGECGRSWDDSIGTEWTPAPAARCPFEYFH